MLNRLVPFRRRPKNSRNTVILGATKGMGRALARLMADRGDRIFLVGRTGPSLARSADDLTVRSGSVHIRYAHCDLEDPESFDSALDHAEVALGSIDTVIVTAGIFATEDEVEQAPELAKRLLHTDFTNTVLFCEAARKRLLKSEHSTLCVFSSVAGDRGRKPAILYGAAKAGLSLYLEGLDHRYRADGLHTICVKPGFVRTSMTEGRKVPPFAGESDPVARRVLRAIDRGTPVVYAPILWGPMMRVIRALPRRVMRRIDF